MSGPNRKVFSYFSTRSKSAIAMAIFGFVWFM